MLTCQLRVAMRQHTESGRATKGSWNLFFHGDPNSAINKLGLYGNPYSPASATNFEAIPASSRYDQGRLSTNLYNPDWLRNPFGHYGNPYSPHQFNNR